MALRERVRERFSSPEEEIAYLRERMHQLEREQQSPAAVEQLPKEDSRGHQELVAYAAKQPAEVLEEHYVISEEEAMHVALDLKPESHDAQIARLLQMVTEKGIKNALTVASQMKNPHMEDDFHRALVRYIALNLPFPTSGHPERAVWEALHFALYEVHPQGTMPDSAHGERRKPLKELLDSMVQLYAGLLSIASDARHYVTLEMAVAEGTEEAILYIAVPREKGILLTRLVLSVFPYAAIIEQPNDYNVFINGGVTLAAYATLDTHPALPLKTFEQFEHDPMNVILAAFAKLQKHGEAAAVQITIGSEGDRYNKYYHKILNALNSGKKFKEATTVPETVVGEVADDFYKALFKSERKETDHESDRPAIDAVTRKIATRIVPASIKLIASAEEQTRAKDILNNLISTFHQFDDPTGNRLVFKTVSSWSMSRFIRAYTLRLWESSYAIPLSLAELTSMYHLTAEAVSTSRELKQSRAKQLPAPVAMPHDGIVLGHNRFGGHDTNVMFGPNDRLRHFYCIGQTGTGKSTLMTNMIEQDIHNGEGVCYIDPHGSDIQRILASVPPERIRDVVYFDPAATERPMGLNMLEYDERYPELKTRVVDDLYTIFRQIYADVPDAFGPMFEQYYRNATMLVVDDPESGSTLVEISRVFADDHFRALKISRCKNPLIKQFWEKIAMGASRDAALGEIAPYIISKIDVFLTNEIMRPIVAQQRSAFDFRKMMDERKIFLANLSKGRLGERNAALLGHILVSKFTQAALSRVDARGDLPVFYLYIDEFQNFTTPSISTILSEARKYKLSLHVAHQFIKQLDEKISNAIFGNVGTKCVFRVGEEDAEFLAKTLQPDISASDIVNLDNFNAYLALLVDGKPAKPFNVKTLKPEDVNYDRVDELKQMSYRAFGRDRAEVEEEINRKFTPSAPQPRTPADWYV